MKFTAFFILAVCLHVSGRGYTQTVTLSLKDASLEQVFKAVEKQSGYTFVYAKPQLEHTRRVDLFVKEVGIEEVLGIIFKDQPVGYTISKKFIVVKNKEILVMTSLAALPPIDVKGRVVNENGDQIAGVTVTVKGTKQATATNGAGEFSLNNADKNAVLVFTGSNVETFEVNVSGQAEIMVKLTTKVNKLDEVQVIAYGTTTKRLNTANITTVKAADIEKQPVNNLLLALEGRVPGLFITQSSGLPGTSVKIRLQGQNSIAKGNDPLYIVDGVPYTAQLLQGSSSILGTGSPFSYINPGDIESIDVLKDADATAIYGSRAANGAILITTKRGKSGQAKTDINIQSGIGQVPRKLKLLNTQQYLQMRHEALSNDGITPSLANGDLDLLKWDTTSYIDWQKRLIGGTAKYTNGQISFSGGNALTQFFVGLGYHRETTVFPGDYSDWKGSLHFNLNTMSANQKFRMQLSTNYVLDNNRLMYQDITNYALTRSPNAPDLYNSDGSLNWGIDSFGTSTVDNPLSYIYNKYKNKTNNFINSLVLNYQVFDGLEIKSNFGYTNLQTNEISTFPLVATAPENQSSTPRFAQYSNNNISSWIAEPQINYKKTLRGIALSALVGVTIQQNINNGQVLSGSGYNSDLVLEDIKSASSVSAASTVSTTYKYDAFFSRVNFNFDDKYILNLTGRRDGSSRFGSENKFHNFGAVGIGWILSKEKYIQKILPSVSFAKIRANYGTTGNDQIGDYQYLNLYTPTGIILPYQSSRGLQVNGLQNPYLQWEETRKFQVGLDLGVFKDRILISVNYIDNRSSNQLLNYLLPIISGFNTVTKNFPATVRNSAIEISINSTNIKSNDFYWSTSLNFTLPKNKLIDFPNIASSPYATSLVIGQPINIIKAYHFLGVDPSTGVYQFSDSHDNKTFSPNFATDRTISIITSPRFYGGLENNFSYKGIQLGFLLQFVKQLGRNDFRFGQYPGAFSYYGGFNQPDNVLQRWKKSGDLTSIQRYNSNYSVSSQFDNALKSDAAYEDASYVRLKNVSLSWNLPNSLTKKLKFQSCRMYIQGQNLLCITKYKGLDPETLSNSNLPPLRVLTVGVQVAL